MQVTRKRRAVGKLRLPAGRNTRIVMASSAAALLLLTGTGIAYASSAIFGDDQVGTTVSQGLVVSDNQIINPYGTRLVIPEGKIMGSVISPDGTHMAATLADGPYDMVIINLSTMAIQQYVHFGNGVGQESPTYSPDGSALWMGTNNGYAKYAVAADGSVSSPVAITLPTVNSELPLVGKAVFSADGSTVYGAVNGQNTVVAMNASTGAVTQTWNVGNAPRDLLLVGSKLYVSDEGGRTATSGDTTLNSYGTQVPASDLTGSSTTGAVSVIDLSNPSAAPATIAVGLHPTALYYANGAVFVANTNSDTVSVIDAKSNQVVQTIGTQPWPEAKVGYEPDAITVTGDGHLLVSLGGANAIAAYKFDNPHDWNSPRDAVNYIGLIPTDYFPVELANVSGQIVVTNMRGIDARRSTTTAHGTHDTTSSLTYFTLPSDGAIRQMTDQVFQDNGWTGGSVKYANLAAKDDDKPVPVPTRIGAPSTIKYVFLIVKENRTYDQMFGDMPQGNGDPAYTQYGEAVTPNNHALATQFGLYDNFYDAGTNSAEGHNWLMQADNPDYTQSLAGQYDRSYDTEDDALGHQASGTLWSGVESAGKTVRDYGEFQEFLTKPAAASWQNLYCDALTMDSTGSSTAYPMTSTSPIPSLNSVSDSLFPKFDTSVPDIYRYEIWKQEFDKTGPSNLNMFWLSSDHTGGPPSPAAQVADNDLALGKIVETISHSKYWPQSAIFVVEDDSQAGTDHVDGHRAPIQIISPWAQRGIVDNTYYTQVNMIRTIENILGMHPMNQKDSAATPMYGAFTSTPNYTPYTAVDNQTSLTAGLSTMPSCGANVPGPLLAGPTTTTAAIKAAQHNRAAVLKADALGKPAIPAAMRTIAAQWAAWLTKQHTTGGTNATPDYANPEQMNRYDWYVNSNFTKPYPGDSKIYAPSQVPGVYLASSDNEG